MAKNKRVSIIISAKNKVKGVFKSVRSGLSGIGKLAGSIFSPTGLIAAGLTGFGVAKLAGSFLDAAKQTENYKIRLQGLLGSQTEGNRLFKEMAEYAGRVPFEYEQIMASATQLAGILKGGVNEIKEWMPLIGDLAAASGLDIQTATEQVSRMLSAGAASADLFRERGVLAMLGFNAGVSYSVEDTRKMLMDAWNAPESRFKGATSAMANTWDGMVSMLKDGWFSFRNLVMDSGPFQVLKSTLRGLIDEVDRLKDSGKLKEIAGNIGEAITGGLKKFINAMPSMARGIIKAAEMLLLALSGWKQMRGLWEIMFTQVRVWSLEFINDLRMVFIRLLAGIGRIPGVDTSRDIKDTYMDIGETFERIDAKGGLAEQLEQAKVKLGQVQIKQDEMVEKYEAMAASAEKAFGRVRDVALKGLEEGAKKAGDATVESSAQAVAAIDEEAAALGRLIEKYHQRNLAAGRKGGSFNVASLSAALDDAERTE